MEELNKLKTTKTKDIEKAIAQALSELTGVQYACTVSNIEYDIFEGGKLELSVYTETNFTSKKRTD